MSTFAKALQDSHYTDFEKSQSHFTNSVEKTLNGHDVALNCCCCSWPETAAAGCSELAGSRGCCCCCRLELLPAMEACWWRRLVAAVAGGFRGCSLRSSRRSEMLLDADGQQLEPLPGGLPGVFAGAWEREEAEGRGGEGSNEEGGRWAVATSKWCDLAGKNGENEREGEGGGGVRRRRKEDEGLKC
uniref:Uncharacterized protein n=1 Tax=Solanum tuberosum TaxID=4113 RepID=M1C902_SOLTU